MKKRNKINFERIETGIYIIVFTIIIIVQALRSFIPVFDDWMDEFLTQDILLSIISFLIINIYLKVLSISKTTKTQIESFDDAINVIFSQKKKFKEVKIYAYSAKNYIDQIRKNNVRITNLSLLLKRADNYSAWFLHDEKSIKKYNSELGDVLQKIQQLIDDKKIKQCQIKYYDFESYSHFGIFDSYAISGNLIPQINRKTKVVIGKV